MILCLIVMIEQFQRVSRSPFRDRSTDLSIIVDHSFVISIYDFAMIMLHDLAMMLCLIVMIEWFQRVSRSPFCVRSTDLRIIVDHSLKANHSHLSFAFIILQ